MCVVQGAQSAARLLLLTLSRVRCAPIRVTPVAPAAVAAATASYDGVISGEVHIELENLDGLNARTATSLVVPLVVRVVPPPPRARRLLFDSAHSIDDGIEEVKALVVQNRIKDLDHARYSNQRYLQEQPLRQP